MNHLEIQYIEICYKGGFMIIGGVYGKTGISKCNIVCHEKIRFGEFVVLKNIDDEEVLGTVEDVSALEDGKLLGKVKIIGVIRNGNISQNRSPIKIKSEVRSGDGKDLANLYYNPKGLNIGHLIARGSIRVYLDANNLVSKHFAILSVTGGGKSNTVIILCRELAKIGGSVVILDPYGE